MKKKVKKYNAQILSHRNDRFIFTLMVLFTACLTGMIYAFNPEEPNGWPQPSQSKWKIETSFEKTYDIHIDREIVIGQLNEDGWWNLDMIALYYIDVEKCVDCNQNDLMINVTI